MTVFSLTPPRPRFHLLPAMLCLYLEISGDGGAILVRVSEVPGVGDDFWYLGKSTQGLQVSVVPGVGATLLGLSVFWMEPENGYPVHLRAQAETDEAVLFINVSCKVLVPEHVVSRPRHSVTSRAESGLCSLVRSFPSPMAVYISCCTVETSCPSVVTGSGLDTVCQRVCVSCQWATVPLERTGRLVLCTGCVFSTLYTPVSFVP